MDEINKKFENAGITGVPELTQNKMDEIAKEMKSAFKPFEGASLPFPLLKTQERFSHGTNVTKKFSFYPNCHITPTIFSAIENNTNLKLKQMIIGSKGISKSVGFILGWHLSSKSIPFRFKYASIAAKLA